MATPAQIAANRRNAQKSTGPRTPEGKAASSFNALRHSLDAQSLIIPGEDPAAYDALVREYQREFHPVTPSDNFHVDTMVRADWHKRRLQRIEADLYRTVLTEAATDNLVEAILSGTPAAKLLTRVQRQIVAFERAWYRAHTELTRARDRAQADEEDAFETFLDRALPVDPLPPLASFPTSTATASPVSPTRHAGPVAPLPPVVDREVLGSMGSA